MNIYSDQNFLPDSVKHSIPMLPFWGDYHPHNGFHRFGAWAREHWRLTEVSEADVGVLPFDGREWFLQKGRRLREVQECGRRFVERMEQAGLRTLVLVNSDRIDRLPLGPSAVVLRTSLDRCTRRPNEFALSATHEDIVDTHLGGQLSWRPYHQEPTVGFCGLAARSDPPLKRRAKLAAHSLLRRSLGLYVPANDGIYLRGVAIRLLEGDPSITTRFVIRDRYFHGGVSRDSLSEPFRLDYIQNILESDYVLCVRGYGNFSFRFYEAMSLGRTPVLVDTECVLPYDFLHDYRDLCVILPASEVTRIGDRVREFHGRFVPESYREHQQRVRRFWEDWLSPKGFFEHLPEHWATSPARGSSVKRSQSSRASRA